MNTALKPDYTRRDEMKREIKFRAWNGRSMEYGGFSIHATGKILPMDGLTGINGQSQVMQYIGLEDKNGSEIYEGDIIRWSVNDTSVTAPIGYEDGAFWMLNAIDKSYGNVYNDWLRGEYEIIGNIHKNPNLLTGEMKWKYQK